jgi:hypothetical protein
MATAHKKTSPVTWLALIVVIVFVAFVYIPNSPKVITTSTTNTTQPVAEIKALSPQQQIDQQFSKLDGSHILLTKMIKKDLHDPSSYQHVNTQYTQTGEHITVLTQYHAANAFGALTLSHIKFRFAINGTPIALLEQN